MPLFLLSPGTVFITLQRFQAGNPTTSLYCKVRQTNAKSFCTTKFLPVLIHQRSYFLLLACEYIHTLASVSASCWDGGQYSRSQS